jgi:RNA polymerase sigma-70 factor, ECF subfamily
MNDQAPAAAAMPPASTAADFQRDLVALIPYLRAFSRTLCGNRALAEDMAQEALVKAWRARDRFEPGTNLKGWLFTILRNEFYSHARGAWREIHWDADLGERIPSAGREQESIMELSDMARALRSLPDGQREALILVSAGGFSYEDAAEICAAPVGTMKRRVARTRAALSKILDGNQPTPLCARVANASHDILAQLSALTPPVIHGRTADAAA